MAGSVSLGLVGGDGFCLLLLDFSLVFSLDLTCAFVGGGGRRGGCMCECVHARREEVYVNEEEVSVNLYSL